MQGRTSGLCGFRQIYDLPSGGQFLITGASFSKRASESENKPPLQVELRYLDAFSGTYTTGRCYHWTHGGNI
jgi:hypothetical protein